MNPYRQPFEQALESPSSQSSDGPNSPVRLLAVGLNQTMSHLVETRQRILGQPKGTLRDQRVARLGAIEHRLMYMQALMNLLGEQYAGVPLYDAAVLSPQTRIPSWATLNGVLADGLLAESYSVAQILDEAIARPLFEGDYNTIWSQANVAIGSIEVGFDGDEDVGLASLPPPPPGRMNVGEWDQIDLAEVATQPAPSSTVEEDEETGLTAYNAYNPRILSQGGGSGNGQTPWWVWVAGAGLAGLMVGLIIARHRSE